MVSPLRKRAKLAPLIVPSIEFPTPIATTDVFGTLAPETVIQILEEVYAASDHRFSRLRLLSRQFNALVRPIRYRSWILRTNVDKEESTAAARSQVIQDVLHFTKHAILTYQENWRVAIGSFSETIPNVEVIEWNYAMNTRIGSALLNPRGILTSPANVKEDIESIFAQPPPHLRELRFESNPWEKSCLKNLFLVRGAILPNFDCLVLKNFFVDPQPTVGLESPQHFSTIRTLILHSRFLKGFLEEMHSSNANISQIKTLELVDDGMVSSGVEISDLFRLLVLAVQRIETLESFSLCCEYAVDLPRFMTICHDHGPTLKVLKFLDTRTFRSSILPPLDIEHFQKMVEFCCVLKKLEMNIDVRASGTFNIVKIISKLPNLSELILHIPTLNDADTDTDTGTGNPATPGLLAPDFNSAKSILTFVLRERISPYLRKIIILVKKLKRPRSFPPEHPSWFDQYEHYYDWAPDVVGISGVGTIREMVWDPIHWRLTPQTDYSYCWPLAV